MVILSSGVWTQKFDTTFAKTDMVILDGIYSDEKDSDGSYVYPEHITELTNYVQSLDSDVKEYNGVISIVDGRPTVND